jgi:competence protein ComEA
VQFAAGVLLVVVTYFTCRFFHVGDRPRPTERVAILAPIDLNQASRAELVQLPGVGEHGADAILAARDRRGGFQSVDDLREVPGIGPARFDDMKHWVHVDTPGRERPPAAGKSSASRAGTRKAPPTTAIDVNRATAAELQKLPGVGPVTANRIIAERERAPFRSVDELRRVAGIGAKTLDKLRPLVTVGPPPDTDVAAAQ